MPDKESILRAIAGLPDSINWEDVADGLASVVARNATEKDIARFLGAAFPITPEELAEYQNPPVGGMQLRDLLAELEALGPNRAAG